jgi:hypothetical protein
MQSEKFVEELMRGRRRKRFPRALLAVTDNALRREAMLALTKHRFIVDECSSSSTLVPKWEHSAKYDIVLVCLDIGEDTNAQYAVTHLRRLESEPQNRRLAVAHCERERRLGDAPPIAIDEHAVVARVKYANDQTVPPTFVLGCYTSTDERHGLDERNEFTYLTKIPFSQGFLNDLSSWFTVPDPILPLTETPTVQQVLQFVIQANRTNISQGNSRERLTVNMGSTVMQSSGANLQYERQLLLLRDDLAAANSARDAAEEEASATLQRMQVLRAELDDAKEQTAASLLALDVAEKLIAERNSLYATLEAENQSLIRALSEDTSAGQRHSDLLHAVNQTKKLRDNVFDAQSQLLVLQAECSALEKRLERAVKNSNNKPAPRVSIYASVDSTVGSSRKISGDSSVKDERAGSIRMDVPVVAEFGGCSFDDEEDAAVTKSPMTKLASTRSLRNFLRRTSSSARPSVTVVEAVMQPSLQMIERYENTIMSLHDDLGRVQLHNAMQIAALKLSPQTPLNLSGALMEHGPSSTMCDIRDALPSPDRALLQQLTEMRNEVEVSIRSVERDLAVLSTTPPSRAVAITSRGASAIVDPVALATEKGLLRTDTSEHDAEINHKIAALVDIIFTPIKDWMMQMHTSFRNVLHDLAVDGMQQFATDSKNSQALILSGAPVQHQQLLNHMAKYFQRNIRSATKSLLDLQLRNHQRMGLAVRKSIEGMGSMLKPMIIDFRRAVQSGRVKKETEGGSQTEKLIAPRRPSAVPSAVLAAGTPPRRPTTVQISPLFKTEI